MPSRATRRGFTLVELMVTITLMAILIMAAAPSLSTWINNTRVRTLAEAFQNGLRQAQAEAVRRNRTMVFFLTNAQPSTLPAAATGGLNWGIRSTTLLVGDTAEFVAGGALADSGAGVSIGGGPAVVCFGAAGPQVALAAADGGTADCAVSAKTFDFTRTGADRRLRVTVAIGGQVRMCDRDRSLAANQPDGC